MKKIVLESIGVHKRTSFFFAQKSDIFPFILGIILSLGTLLLATGLLIAGEPSKVAQVERGELKTARVSWWSSDSSDDTAFLQSALDSKAQTIIVDKKSTPWITCPLKVPSNKEIVLEEGAEIVAKQGEFQSISAALFHISGVKNVTIRGEGTGAVLRMRKADYHQPPYAKSEWRHGLSIKSSENVTVENVSIVATGGDGIYLGVAKQGVPCKNIRISKVICDDNNRQGISVISAENLLIEDTVMKNTKGTAPESGIDFEPNHFSEKLVNCVMRRCICENNAGDAYQFYLPNLNRSSGPASIVLEDCVSKNNGRASLALAVGNGPIETLTGSFTVKNCQFENDNKAILIQGKSLDGMKLLLDNVKLIVKDSSSGKTTVSPITVSSRPADEDPLGNMSFNNITVYDKGDLPVIAFYDRTLNGEGLTGVTGAITRIQNGQKTSVIIDENWCKKNYPVINYRKMSAVDPNSIKAVPFGKSIEKNSAVILRHKGEYLLYAKQGETVSAVFLQMPVGRAEPSTAPALIIAPSGKTTKIETNGKFRTPNNLTFTAQETGIYQLNTDVKTHGSILTSSNVPIAIGSSKQYNLVYFRGTCYFHVPEGAKEFALRIVGENAEKVKVTVYDPNGKEYWQQDDITGVAICYSPEKAAPQPGVWAVKIDRPSTGVLEDFHLSLLGVPSYFFCSPKMKLIEK